MFADLHLHTCFSDGTYTPEELVAEAKRCELQFGLRRRRQYAIAMLDTSEHGLNRIIISLTDRIELVVVASRTTGRQSQKSRAGRVNHVVQLVHAH